VSGSLYASDVRDEIFFVASETALLSGFFTNVDRTRREGAELAAQLNLGDRFFGYLNYAYTRAKFGTAVELFSIRSDSAFVASPLFGPNDVRSGDRLPLVPAHQVKAGALVRVPGGFEAGVDGRFIGGQWLRGDEANETRPLRAYFVADARVGYSAGGWEIAGIVTNLFDSKRAVFGTFNENRRTGELERFFTPLSARGLKLIVRREFGARSADNM